MSDPEVHRKLVEEHVIDETPISPVRSRDPSRRNSLEHHLQTRPSREELIGKHILLDTNAAPAIQGQQKELEKSMRADTLKEKIAQRPSPDKLVSEGVLRDDPRSAEKRYEEAIEDEYAKREGGA